MKQLSMRVIDSDDEDTRTMVEAAYDEGDSEWVLGNWEREEGSQFDTPFWIY